MKKMLEIKEITKVFGEGTVNEKVALNHVNLTLHSGDFVTVIGNNGAGKSTLLRCATMLETIDGGEIIYLGKRASWVENGKAVFPKKNELKEIEVLEVK